MWQVFDADNTNMHEWALDAMTMVTVAWCMSACNIAKLNAKNQQTPAEPLMVQYLGCAVSPHVGKHIVKFAGLQVGFKALNQLMHNLQQPWPLLQGAPVSHQHPLAP